MPTTLGSLRRLILTPSLVETTFSRRGFPVADNQVTRRLEAIPQAVICGFEWGVDTRSLWELERRLELVDIEMRGFAYEGAAMALTVLDAMGTGRAQLARQFLSGPAVPHTFLTYIGIGFAMARLPRVLWKKVLPDLTGTPYYPTMSWLAVDGYGFDKAFFHTERYVTRQELLPAYPWQGRAEYFPRAVDQGIGRALWFIHGAGCEAVAGAVERFTPGRHADLWSGVGLAATFAGGADSEHLVAMRSASGEHAPHLAQGAVFAARARDFSGHVPPHTGVAVGALTGLDVDAAVVLADKVADEGLDSPTEPPYEVWRRRIRECFPVAVGDSPA
ncbi:DUF1702 family protein [Micromonospora sp. ZYX-F-536]|uniref:DUF1702 family protein n=1 Tax=Micromonospora sp. ZYX-F-536 TaxID=3457629 RepID=UPI00404072DF